MIATWIVYGVAIGSCLAAVAWLVERACLQLRRPSRGAWLAAIIVTTSLLATAMFAPPALLTRDARSSSVVSAARRSASPTANIAGTNNETPGHWHRWALAQRLVPELVGTSSALSVLRAKTAGWNRTLAIAWAATTLLLLMAIGQSTRAARRVIVEESEIDGDRVGMTEVLGPAAVGLRRPIILLPRWTSEIAPHLRALILQHEREHLASRDPALLFAAVLLVALVPWNLPLWWTLVRLRLSIEIDCDARVLRRHSNVRQYGQLLLLVSQRERSRRWTNLLPQFAVITLRPRRSHLSQRILAMTRSRTKSSTLTAALLLTGAAIVGSTSLVLPVPAQATTPADAVTPSPANTLHTAFRGMPIVRGTIALRPRYETVKNSGGTQSVIPESEKNREILIYTVGPARFSLNADTPALHRDTVRITMPATMSVDLTGVGEVHFASVDKRDFDVSAIMVGGSAMELTAHGRHIALERDGNGIRTMRQ